MKAYTMWSFIALSPSITFSRFIGWPNISIFHYFLFLNTIFARILCIFFIPSSVDKDLCCFLIWLLRIRQLWAFMYMFCVGNGLIFLGNRPRSRIVGWCHWFAYFISRYFFVVVVKSLLLSNLLCFKHLIEMKTI